MSRRRIQSSFARIRSMAGASVWWVRKEQRLLIQTRLQAAGRDPSCRKATTATTVIRAVSRAPAPGTVAVRVDALIDRGSSAWRVVASADTFRTPQHGRTGSRTTRATHLGGPETLGRCAVPYHSVPPRPASRPHLQAGSHWFEPVPPMEKGLEPACPSRSVPCGSSAVRPRRGASRAPCSPVGAARYSES